MMRRTLLLIAVLAAALPFSVARASHCESQIFLFSYVHAPVEDPLDPNRQQGSPTIVSSAVGCIVIGSDDPGIPGDESDTDYIYPGSDTLVARWLGGGIPEAASLTFAGQTHELHFYNTTNGLGAVVDSQQIFIDPALSFDGGDAVVTVCPDGGTEECDTRVYRTLG